MIFRIKLAGKIVEISSLYKLISKMCERYVIPESQYNLKPDIYIKITEDDISVEEKIFLRYSNMSNEIEITPEYFETLSVYRKIAIEMLNYNILLMHGAAISTNSQGYIISAPSGIGKTTRTKLWIENIPNSIVINGDKPLIKIEPDSVDVYGTPWCGKEGWNNNTYAPLKAVFFLERSESNEIVELDREEAFFRLLKQTYHPKDADALRKALFLLKDLCQKVHFFQYKSMPNSDSVLLAYKTASLY